MTEANVRAVSHQNALVLSLVQCGGNVHAFPDQRRCHRCGDTRAVERGQQYGAPGRCGQAGELLLVDKPKTVANGQRAGQRRGSHSLGIAEVAGDLQDAERVAARVIDQPLDDSIRNAIRHQCTGVGAGQAGECHNGHSLHELRRNRAASRRPHEAHWVVAKATGREPECRCGLAVNPLQVIDQHKHRRPF